MKNNRLNRKLYEQQEKIRLEELHKKMINESLTNSLLKRYEELPEYFRTWRKDAELVAVIPALDHNDDKSRSYFSVGTIKDGEENNNIRISPVFMYVNEDYFDSLTNNYHPDMKCFIFDSEDSKLYKHEKKPHSQQYHYVKNSNYEEMREYIISHPIVLYFKGCDDGHVGKRFKTKDEAFEYLQLIEVFEDIFDEDLHYHN